MKFCPFSLYLIVVWVSLLVGLTVSDLYASSLAPGKLLHIFIYMLLHAGFYILIFFFVTSAFFVVAVATPQMNKIFTTDHESGLDGDASSCLS